MSAGRGGARERFSIHDSRGRAVFQIKAGYDEQLEVKTTLGQAREFFADLRNFVELMPGVESIKQEAGGVARWLIRAEIPVIGAVRHAFTVEQTADAPERIEWS